MPTADEDGFVSRLRSRHLFRWGIGYVAGAWVLLQAAELLFGIFDWSTVWLRVLTVLLVFGFVATIVLAWFHGERGQQRVSAIELVLLVVVLLGAFLTLRFSDFLVDEPSSAATANLFEGKASRRATANSFYEGDPSWSPDSTSLVFASQRSGNSDLWLLQRSGAVTQLTSDPAEDSQPAWSPSGNTILFVSSRRKGEQLDRSVFYGYSFGGDIFSVPAFGGGDRLVFDLGETIDYTHLSPDGRTFVFTREKVESDIWLIE